MKYNVYQHWDPLKVCIVGRSYRPEFYSFIKNDRVRTVMERIARETEEDYQKLIALLESFGVKVLRPEVSDDYTLYINSVGKIEPPPMTPRDYSIMLGDEFYFKASHALPQAAKNWQGKSDWQGLRGPSWPEDCPSTVEELDNLPEFVIKELKDFYRGGEKQDSKFNLNKRDTFTWGPILEHIQNNNVCYSGCYFGNEIPVYLNQINSAETTRIGRDIYIGTEKYGQNISNRVDWLNANRTDFRWHKVDTGGHADGTYCPVNPGLIVSLYDVPTYADTYPGWEVVYLPGQSWEAVQSFMTLKEKNYGKWWVPGEELNDDFTDFVEEWLNHWVGYVEETVFDVNMLVIDEHNVVCNNYNEKVFEAFDRYGITPHVVNFRHRYFWDGGLHCITSDVHRESIKKDYFPERG
jgi:hypothetical protein